MPWQWEENLNRYRDADTGRFISSASVRDLVDQRQRITGSGSDGLAELLRGGQLNTRDWETGMREAIKDEYIQQYLLGRGGLSQMTQADWGSIGGMIADQYRYLDGFTREVAAGTLSEAQVAARSRMYIHSGREAFERASARAHGLPELPAYPGDGKTVCLTNCACNWRIEEVYDDDGNLLGWNCYWELGEAEHCPDCVANSGKWNPLFIKVR